MYGDGDGVDGAGNVHTDAQGRQAGQAFVEAACDEWRPAWASRGTRDGWCDPRFGVRTAERVSWTTR